MATAKPVGRVGPVAAFLAAWLAGAGAGQNVARPRIDAVFDEWNRRDSPGCALGVYENGRIAYGYTLLATIVERATRVPFASYANALIFEPIGMQVTLSQGRVAPGEGTRIRVLAVGQPVCAGHPE